MIAMWGDFAREYPFGNRLSKCSYEGKKPDKIIIEIRELTKDPWTRANKSGLGEYIATHVFPAVKPGGEILIRE